MIHLTDVLEFSIRGVLLIYLCNGMAVWKKTYAKQGKYLFFLLFVILGYRIGNSEWLARILYGESMIPIRSSFSIVKLFLAFLASFLLIDFFYAGGRLIKLYLVLLYQTITELSRFGVHGIWSLFSQAFYDNIINDISEERIPFGTFENFNLFLEISQYIWHLVLMLLYTGIAWATIYTIRKFRSSMRDISRQGTLFLMISPAVGLAFSLAVRSIFYIREGVQIEYIYDKHRVMYAIIPLMTFLCLLSIIYSIRIYGELMRTQDEKNSMFFYKQQLSDMTKHVQDMERLYDGIRGMRHDMNNYIADMEQLLGASMNHGGFNESVESEAEGYLNHMKSTMDSLSVKYSTGNPVTDVIINRKYQECEKEGFAFASDFIYPEKLGIEAFDMGILLNNALDNAIEGCKRCMKMNMEKKKMEIRVHSYKRGRMFFVRIENDCDVQSILYTKENALHTTKEDEWMHGIGLKNMQKVVERYYGNLSHEIKNNTFYLTIMLQEKQDL